ncbi:hypothetical protein FHX74_002181 [Friedmanniella endophytica]|uniref:Uncharacterized protein n=1 Tax=Microlunatus kandeliicorticis TaxID=1759536 RepID=A0A7W3P643_9ACTN|nr:hypothetical protein [Microlunatus kandeliicorticis]MBA8794562.1 hypothetical protein [Microlunatus kandeliicorticis]
MTSALLDRHPADRTPSAMTAAMTPAMNTDSGRRRVPHRGRRWAAPLGALLAVALLIGFVAAGASRMVEVTAPDRAPAAALATATHHHRPAGYGASLWPLGFTVHWNDGTDETHLWW